MFNVVVNGEEKFVLCRFSMLVITKIELIGVLSLPSILEEKKGMTLIPSEICVWRGRKPLKEPRKLLTSSLYFLTLIEPFN